MKLYNQCRIFTILFLLTIKAWIFEQFGQSYSKRISYSSKLAADVESISSTPSFSYSSNKCKKMRFNSLIPFLLLFSVTDRVEASPLNPQLISLRGPFFQGWLVRTTDHVNDCSFITIVGSFSKSNSNKYSEHYIFVGIQSKDKCWQVEAFPSPDTVTINGDQPSVASLFKPIGSCDIVWASKDYGSLSITDDCCKVEFSIQDIKVHSVSKNHVPWKLKDVGNVRTFGPEGWLGYTTLLPCHYYVQSTGSECNYNITCLNGELHGTGFSHIEGNHGTFFPEGWCWIQGISKDNNASISLVAGKFQIGPVKPMNIVFYLRKHSVTSGFSVNTFRTTDLDQIDCYMDSVRGVVVIKAVSASRDTLVELEVQSDGSLNSFGSPIYIPTAEGFSNQPGCRETYTASATVKVYKYDWLTLNYKKMDEIEFRQVALEFGASFQNKIQGNSNLLQPSMNTNH